jgi:hypothetical protein
MPDQFELDRDSSLGPIYRQVRSLSIPGERRGFIPPTDQRAGIKPAARETFLSRRWPPQKESPISLVSRRGKQLAPIPSWACREVRESTATGESMAPNP